MEEMGITQLLLKWSEGDEASLHQLTPLVYDELRRLARSYLRRHAFQHSLQPTVIVHEAWLKLVDQWKNFDDVKKTFRTAGIHGDCTIFDIGGNNYRLIASINYQMQQVRVQTVLTHAEYDKEKWKSDC